MNALRGTALLTCLCALASTAPAQDYLEPEAGPLNRFEHQWDYEQTLRRTLLKDAAPHYRARLLCLPSFGGEWMVTIVREDDGTPGEPDDRRAYFLEYVGAESNLFRVRDAHLARLTRRRVPLDRETAEAVVAAWRGMLRDVRYPEEHRLGADGTTYHFARAVPHFDRGRPTPLGGFEAGQIWSPAPGTPTSDLVALGEALRKFALGTPEAREATRTKIRTDAARLKTRLDGRRVPDGRRGG